VSELQELQVLRKELDERVETASRLVSGSGAMLANPQEASTAVELPSFVIIRHQDGLASEFNATETTPLQPGDVVKVFRPQDVISSRRAPMNRPVR
jgi:hypothetical protein